MKTELKDRTVWFDGTNEVQAKLAPDLLLLGITPDCIVSADEDDDVQSYNNLIEDPSQSILSYKDANRPLDKSWNIPQEYSNLDLDRHVINLANKFGEVYVNRAVLELHEIHDRGLADIFKTLVFIVDTLKSNKQVWGVGRGSSCASLVLFLLDLHKVDPVKYNIPISEFFHD